MWGLLETTPSVARNFAYSGPLTLSLRCRVFVQQQDSLSLLLGSFLSVKHRAATNDDDQFDRMGMAAIGYPIPEQHKLSLFLVNSSKLDI